MTPLSTSRSLKASSAALLLAIGLAIGLAAPIGAQVQEVGDVRASVTTVWPSTLAKGYVPLWVTLENTADEPRKVELEATATAWRGPEREASQTVQLEPGDERVVELFAPMFSQGSHDYSTYMVLARVGGDRTYLSTSVGSSGWAEDLRSLVVFTDRSIETTESLLVSERLKTGELSTGRRSTFRAVMSGGSAKSAGSPNVHAAVAGFEWMPSRYHAYTSLDAVVVDVQSGPPPENALDPLLTWARLGGRVVFLGDDALEELSSSPAVRGWLEERFEVARGDGDGGRLFTCGLGFVYFGEGKSLIESDASIALVRDVLRPVHPSVQNQSAWVPFPGSWRLKGDTLEIPGVGRIPLRTFMGLLFLFVIAIGPLNMHVLRKLGRPALLLVTIPAVSVAFSGALLAYGILHQGVDVKTASRTVTVLDQRSHHASTVEHRSMFVGLSPGPGLRPAAGTSVFPVQISDQSDRYSVKFDDGLLLSGSYLPVRDPVSQVLLSDRSARMRLSVRIEDDVVVAQNSFEHPIRSLVVSDPKGRWFRFDGRLDPGETARLPPLEGPARTANVPVTRGAAMDDARLAGILGHHDSSLLFMRPIPPSSYVAVIDVNPFTDDCGVALNELDGRHVIVGVLPLAGEDWE